MNELISRLKKENNSCVVRQKDQIYTKKSHGILPILELLENGVLENAQVVDKVIGKAAAMMMVLGHVQEVYACTISEAALSFLQDHFIKVSYERLVPFIINQNHDGLCPMEQAVLAIDDEQVAYQVLSEKSKHII